MANDCIFYYDYKWFKSINNIINVMKVCKKYKEIVSMYKFNPISDISSFKNIQTQRFCKRENVENKKKELFQYTGIVLIMKNLKIKKTMRKIGDITNAYKYIINNIPTIEEWNGHKFKEIIILIYILL